MQRLLGRYLKPVAIKLAWHVAETPDRIERKIDRIKFDMGQRMNQRSPAFDGMHGALADFTRRYQRRASRTAGQRRMRLQGHRRIELNALSQPLCVQFSRLLDFKRYIRFAKQCQCP